MADGCRGSQPHGLGSTLPTAQLMSSKGTTENKGPVRSIGSTTIHEMVKHEWANQLVVDIAWRDAQCVVLMQTDAGNIVDHRGCR